MRFQNDQILCHSPRCSSHSLIHELAFYRQADFSLYVLRDDQLNPPFSGSKHRKYKGLFQEILNNKFSSVIIPASLASNHLLCSVSLCMQNFIKPLVFSKKPYGPLRPNAQAVLEMLKEDELFYHDDYLNEAKKHARAQPLSYLMPLGGFCQSAAVSALSLGYEIFEFHKQQPLDEVILDAGTGLQASSCLLALEEMGYKGRAHVICMGELNFYEILKQVSTWTHKQMPSFEINVLRSSIAKSYGTSNQTLQSFKQDFFKNTGIILDTVYNAKSFYTLLEMREKRQVQGTCLIVHSGGIYAG